MLNLIRRSNTSSLLSLASEITRLKSLPASSICHQSYYTARPQLQHFRRNQIPRWYQNPRIIATLLLAGGGTVLTIYYGNLETVPYTKRSHLVLLSPSLERQLGEAQFNEIKSSLRSKILPPLHPDAIRVRLISKQIIEAVQRGFGPEDRRWGAIERDEEVRWRKEEEIVDEWVRDSREKGKARESTRHLEGLSWEVMVVRDEMVNAMCLPGGKIIVFSGLLDQFRNDAEIATVIGHEVGFL